MTYEPGSGVIREVCALLQGLATCGVCGRKLAVYYDGPTKATPGYYRTGTGQVVSGAAWQTPPPRPGPPRLRLSRSSRRSRVVSGAPHHVRTEGFR
jgi:hypothetical protein